MHVKDHVGERDFGLGALEADGADKQTHFRLLMREDVLDPRPNPGFGRIAASDICGHRSAVGLAAVDTADPALGLQPPLIALAAVGRVCPYVRSGIVARYHVARHAPVVTRAVRRLALADEPKGPADRDGAFVAEAGDRDVRLRPAIGSRTGSWRI